MATLRELIIKISANSQSFQSEIARASRMGENYYKTMQSGGRQAAAASRESQRALAEVNAQLASVKSTASGMVGALAGAFATGHLINLADQWNLVNARLKQASTSTEDFTGNQSALMALSQKTGTAFADNAGLFARSASSLREYGYSSQDALKVTEALATGLKLSGAGVQESSSVITQFSQALAQGVLRGEEFNSVNENGDRVIRALAAGMGVARKDLKAMADDGKLTADKVVPALISQLGAMQNEFAAMPATVGGSVTKVQNAFQQWVGGINETSRITATLSGTLDKLAGNIDAVATAAGVLVAIGAARYLGNMASGAYSATAGLLSAAKSEVALAEAQLRGTQIATARARAAVYRAQQALVAARGTDAQAAAEMRLNAAQNTLARNISARASAQTALNGVTAIGSRLAGGMLQLIGGWPGALLLAGGSWYAMYQNQEQARRSAQEYANTIDEIRQRSGAMSLTETAENYDKTKSSLSEQNRLIEEQKEKIRLIKVEIEGYQQMLASPGLTISGYMINHLMSVEEATNGLSTATDSLSVEQDRLSRLQGKAQDIQTVLAGLEHRRVVLIRQQAAEQNAAYQSLLRMNGQHTEFNRLLSLGNDLLSARQGNVAAPLRLPNATLSDKQKEAIEKSRQDLELSKLKGEAKELKRLGYSADDLGLTNSPSNQTARQDYINNNLSAWRNDEANKPKPKGAKTDEEKAVDTYDRLIKQQREQLALGSQNTELAKVKYQISQGELSTLSDAQKQELLRSATALDHLKTQERFKELQNELLTPEEELLKKTRERIELLKQAAPATEAYHDAMQRISKATVTEAPKFGGIDASVGGASGELIRVAEAQKQLEEWYKKQLEMQQELLQTQEGYEQEYADRIVEIQATKAQRMQDIQAGYTSASLSMFSDLASQGASLLQTMGEQGSAAYKALFIASKAAAIAQAIINTELAATKAMAEGGMMFGIPAASMIRGVGYASVSLIAAQTLAGMAHDGIDNVPREGTWLLDRGERVVDARTNADLKNYLSTKNVGGVSDEQISAISNNRSNITIAQTIQVSGNGDRALTAAMERAANQGAQQGAALARQQLLQDFQSRGQARRLLGV